MFASFCMMQRGTRSRYCSLRTLEVMGEEVGINHVGLQIVGGGELRIESEKRKKRKKRRKEENEGDLEISSCLLNIPPLLRGSWEGEVRRCW
jgi:hypothetical protein